MRWNTKDLGLLPERIQRQAAHSPGKQETRTSKPSASNPHILSERNVCKQIALYLQLNYPHIIYRFDLAADIRLTIGQAKRNKELHPQRGHPDLFISKPIHPYAGCYLEIKREDKSPYLKNGSGLRKNEHIRDQNLYLENLRNQGYYTSFSVGFDETKQIIDDYLAGNL